ncbi:nucleotidyltransferase domain-containing protein [Sphaerisporangium sp. B11E5]|uniref:nucleotidyltransferase domain-containing protein n=1 Tax=Sphaerisporangium sp. B11E5 TaxID=3153563 RepID=UPI00325E36AB
MIDHAPTAALVDRFLTGIAPLVPLRALWAHGSLAGGDYRPGRSDLDLVAVLDRPCTPGEEERLERIHRRLDADDPLAAGLHCGYGVAGELEDPDRDHLVWAHRELYRRPISTVTRRELHDFGSVLYGDAPDALLPPVTGPQLAAYVVRDQRDYWRPTLAHPEHWLQDIYVDLGMTTHARATVTLRDGALITKAAALAELRAMGAPAEVVDDIERRRYHDAPAPPTEAWLAHRANLTRAWLIPAVDALLAAHPAG